MSGDEEKRYTAPFTADNPVPTIKNYKDQKEAQKEESDKNVAEKFMQEKVGDEERATVEGSSNDNNQPTTDTSEIDASTLDARERRKELKKRKDDEAERQVTDPVTHLPVTIQDFTSDSLKKIPDSNRSGSLGTSAAATGVANQKKSAKQLQEEFRHQQQEHDAMRSIAAPPTKLEGMKHQLTELNNNTTLSTLGAGIAIGAVGAGLAFYIRPVKVSKDSIRRWVFVYVAKWIWVFVAMAAVAYFVVEAIYERHEKQTAEIWDDEVWEERDAVETSLKSGDDKQIETVAWLNGVLGSVWPLVNPDLFTSLADMLEDVMQASLPRMVRMVSVNDIGQGTQSIRILGVRWLPTGAAARSVTEDGKLQKPGDTSQSSNGNQAKQNDSNSTGQQVDDAAQQQINDGLEAEEGDFVNMEIAFAYRAKSKKANLKDRAKDMHMYIAFFLPGDIKLPVWVDLRGLVGTMRMRVQLCPDPPFFSLCTITFLGQPKVELSCTPLNKHALNIMDVPFISNFVQSAVDAAMAQYVAPKSLNLDLQDMISGDDFKKDTHAKGILVVNVKRGYDFKVGDEGIPLIKDGSSDPYVSVGWAKFGKPVWSTRLLLNEMQPWWDETAYVLVSPEEINVDERLRLQLWDSDRMTADDDLGRIEVPLKELMAQQGQGMISRSDGFKALKKGEDMPGKLEWSVGYYAKTSIQDSQLKNQSYDPEIKTKEAMQQKVDEIGERKLREANVKEGRHKKEANELEQQKKQEFKNMEDAMIISAPPPDGYPSGIFSIQIHQITGLELENVSKAQAEKEGEVDDETEEGEGLPSAYCTVIINHNKTFKTRTKPKNAKPFYNAVTERFIADWRTAEVFIAVRDARVKEDDPLLGTVHLPLSELFKERSQVNSFYPLMGGVGYGRIRLSMVWRSVSLQADLKAIGWDYGTVEIKTGVPLSVVPKELQKLKIKFHTDLGSGKMYANKDSGGWNTKNDSSLMLPVRKRYGTCLALQFINHGVISDRTAAFAIFWLKDIPDEEEQEITLTVWKGDYERAKKNASPEPGEKIGSITLKLTFWEGLGAAHSRWASKDHNVREVVDVLDVARDNLEEMRSEEKVGAVDGTVSDSSAEESDTQGGASEGGIVGKAKSLKKHNAQLNKQNRGMMQWKIPRTAKWAYHKVEEAGATVTDTLKHQTNQSNVETEA